MTSTADNLKTHFSSFFDDFIFTERHADIARSEFGEEITYLAEAYRNSKIVEEAKKKKRREDRLSAVEVVKTTQDVSPAAQQESSDLSEEESDGGMEVIGVGTNNNLIHSVEKSVEGSYSDAGVTSYDPNLPVDSRALRRK